MRRLLFVLALIGLSTSPFAQDLDEIADLSAKAARVIRAGNHNRLTPPSTQERSGIVSAYLRGRHDDATVSSLVVDAENVTARGRVHVRLGQRVAGLDVYGTYVRAALTADGSLLAVVENLASISPALLPERVSHRDALEVALGRRYPGAPLDLQEVGSSGNTVTFARGARFFEDPTVTRVAVPMKAGPLRVGYLVETWDRNNQLWHTVVGGSGRILFEQLRTATDSYNIFPNAPNKTPQTIVNGPGSGNTESPIGWVSTNTTIGNNVSAYLDRDNNNAADANGRPISDTQNFLQSADLTQAPTTTANQMVAVTNLFYLNNVVHDKLRRHGFNEAAGNFQTNNFGLGGLGNDPVNAEAQDGGGTNNANFATPADGQRPRMQMYIWTAADPDRDGDLDSDIVYHEYGHGLTWRMIGNMAGPLAGAIGEGMSDVLAIYINRDDRVAEYSKNNLIGIRRFPYTNYPNTYGDITGGSVHADGEIYAATMWKLLEIWESSGRTQDELFDYVIDGMNFTPQRPAYEDMRNGILAATPTQEEDCLVWQAFAQFGIGEGANGNESCNFFGCTIDITESFDVPGGVCGGPPTNTPPNVNITAPATGSSFTQGTSVTFSGTATDDQDGNISANLAWSSNRDGSIGSGASFFTSTLSVGVHTITATVIDNGGLQDSASIQVTITTPGGITLSTSGYKIKGKRHTDLTWSPTGTGNVDVYRNGSKVSTTANDGSHTDVIDAKGGGGTFVYKVCQSGSTTACSNESTVTF